MSRKNSSDFSMLVKLLFAIEELLISTQNTPQKLLKLAISLWITTKNGNFTYSCRILFAICKQTSLFLWPAMPVIINRCCYNIQRLSYIAFIILVSTLIRPLNKFFGIQRTSQITCAEVFWGAHVIYTKRHCNHLFSYKQGFCIKPKKK